MQQPIFAPESSWSIPDVFPQFSERETIAVDLETYDPHLMTCGPGWATGRGHVVGIGIATSSARPCTTCCSSLTYISRLCDVSVLGERSVRPESLVGAD